MSQETKRLEFHGGPWVSFLPLALFVVLIITTTFGWGSISDGALWVPAFVALVIPFFLSKDGRHYASAIMDGIGSRTTAIPIVCWIFAGVFARVLRESGFADGLAGLAADVGMGTTMFLAATFLASAVFATATGTGFGTIAMGMGVLYPAGVEMGVHPALLAGAVLCGAAFGDNMAPVSDTLIASATSMGVDIPGCVRSRFKYAATSGAITLVVLVILGIMMDRRGNAVVEVASNYKALVMFIPLIITLVIAIKLGDIVIATTFGTVLGAITAVVFGLMDVVQIDAVEPANSALVSVAGEGMDRTVGGVIYNGVSGMVQVIILCLLLFAMINIMREGGGDAKLLDTLANVARGPRSAEVVISFMVIIVSSLISLTAPTVLLIGGSFGKPFAKKYGISPYRMANLMSAHTVTFCYALPWTATMLFLLGFASAAGTPLSGVDVFPFMVYAFISTAVMFVTTFVGIGRRDALDYATSRAHAEAGDRAEAETEA